MNCDQTGEWMVNLLYGEEVPPEASIAFFRHLKSCRVCEEEYLGLLETRKALAEWDLPDWDESGTQAPAFAGRRGKRWIRGFGWWPTLQKIAAGILIVFGAFSLLRETGALPGGERELSEDQLRVLVHDLVVAREDENLRLIGDALLDIKEELEARDQLTIRAVYEDLYSMERRYLRALENQLRPAAAGGR